MGLATGASHPHNRVGRLLPPHRNRRLALSVSVAEVSTLPDMRPLGEPHGRDYEWGVFPPTLRLSICRGEGSSKACAL